ncbi:hypothetical protein MRQ36_13630 [Micromonospora sp. R77]|uniref:hypothetical protein n=1 Tax=Micromonospora sp. R77 TaxID=2925836 RepID=UPI001F60928E|nr:hypothetical protein [Micromonospora sp. R77]MCI4063567.1 hypothetical protein [Micromonospora sp. R77]
MGKKDRELDAAVKELAKADTVAFGGVGIAGTLLPATEAYRHVERALDEHPAEARKKVDWLLKHGSPAGKAYAASLLDRVDAEAGRAAWSRLRDHDDEFTTFSGCVMGRATLGEYAAERLAGH